MKIPVYEPLFQGNEKKYLQKCIDSGWVSSDGYFVQKFEEEFAKWSGNKYAIAVCNGTAALETACYSTKVIGEFVLMPVYTIISCMLAILRLRNQPEFYESSKRPKNCSEPVMRCHLFGRFDNQKTKGIVIDDVSQYWKPFKVQDVACYSLYANKLITSGEGGLVVTNKKEVYERAKSYRNLCHSKKRFVHNDLGFNYRMSNLQAAVALAQLEQIDKFIDIKRKNRDLYVKYLPDNIDVLFNVEVPWMYLIETKIDAGLMVNKLKQKGIDCRRFFYPLHRQPCFKGEYEHLFFPASDYAWKHFFYLPSGLTLTERQVKYICDSLKSILNTTTPFIKTNHTK